MKEIDQRIMHLTMHHGTHLSSLTASRIKNDIGERLDVIEKKLDQLVPPEATDEVE